MSGFGAADPVYTVFRTLGDLCIHIKAMHVQRGRPGQTLDLQGSWADVGVYGLVVREACIELSCKHTRRVAVLSSTLLESLDFVLPLVGLTIGNNFSESKATLRQQGQPRSHNCVALVGMYGRPCEDMAVLETPPKRLRVDASDRQEVHALQNLVSENGDSNSGTATPGESVAGGFEEAVLSALQGGGNNGEDVPEDQPSEPPSPADTELA
eukprot:6484394-Amphidinium_carterae.1